MRALLPCMRWGIAIYWIGLGVWTLMLFSSTFMISGSSRYFLKVSSWLISGYLCWFMSGDWDSTCCSLIGLTLLSPEEKVVLENPLMHCVWKYCLSNLRCHFMLHMFKYQLKSSSSLDHHLKIIIITTPDIVTIDPKIYYTEGIRSKKTMFSTIDIRHCDWKIAVVGPASPFTVQFSPTKLVSMWRVLVKMQRTKFFQL